MERVNRRLGIVVGAAILFLLVVLGSAVHTIVDVLWFGELGYRTILTTEITTRAVLFLVTALAVFSVLYVNLRLARRYQRPIPAIVGDITDLTQRLPAEAFARLSSVGVVVLSLLPDMRGGRVSAESPESTRAFRATLTPQPREHRQGAGHGITCVTPRRILKPRRNRP